MPTPLALDKVTAVAANEPVNFSHYVLLKLGHQFHALLNVCSDRDNNPFEWHLYVYWNTFCKCICVYFIKTKITATMPSLFKVITYYW